MSEWNATAASYAINCRQVEYIGGDRMKKRSIGLAARLCALSCAAFVAVMFCWFAHPRFVATAGAAETSLPSPPTEATATLKHGAELAVIGDCAVCHTANRGAPFAGGRPLDTPFGTIYSTNITPDRQTGSAPGRSTTLRIRCATALHATAIISIQLFRIRTSRT
jgi:hypothetical protein